MHDLQTLYIGVAGTVRGFGITVRDGDVCGRAVNGNGDDGSFATALLATNPGDRILAQ